MKTLAVGAAIYLSPLKGKKPQSPPNIIICMTDDQGFGDIGFHGNPDIQTPVLDNLASRSVRFNNFYVSPVCAPTRASLLTGRYSLRTGVFDTYNGGAIMAVQENTLAEMLHSAGYVTGIFGKWHLGDNYPFRPMDRGFEHSLIHAAGGIGQVGDVRNYFKFDKSYFDPVLLKNGQPVQTKGYCSDVFTDAAIAFIVQNKTRPFFLYLAFNAPHTPLQVPDSYYQSYKDLVPTPDRYPSKGQPFPDMNKREIEAARKVYAMVSNIDHNLGRLLWTLKQLDLDDNTVVIFLTDNGPDQRRYIAGLRGRKGSVFEGGVRVPCFVHLPGRLPEDTGIETPVAHIDLLPTVLALCNIPTPNGVLLDGKNLLPLIENRTVDWAGRPLFFHWQRGFPEPYRNIAIRKGRYKLVGKSPHGAEKKDFELFDLENDPYELENIQTTRPDIASSLIEEFDAWYEDIIDSPHLRQIQRIKVGTPHENPVILNRNDAKGSEGIWAQEKIFGYWDVEVAVGGLYDFSFHFKERIKGGGVMKLRMGTLQRSLDNLESSTSILEIKGIPVKSGNYRLEPWYRAKGENFLPFYVEVKKR